MNGNEQLKQSLFNEARPLDAYNWQDVDDNVDNKSDYSDTSDFIHFKIPCVVYNAGRTKCGKSTFVNSMLTSHRIVPEPKKFILSIGALTEEEQRRKIVEQLAVIKLAYPQTSRADVFMVQSMEDVQMYLARLPPSVPKFILIDDMLTYKAGVSDINMALLGAHHHNACVIYQTQNLFTRDTLTIRENSDYIVLWPGFQVLNYSRFFAAYAKPIKDRLWTILSSPGQFGAEYYDGANKTDEMHNCHLRTPAIIDKKCEVPSKITLYAGLWDDEPITLDVISEERVTYNHMNVERDKIF